MPAPQDPALDTPSDDADAAQRLSKTRMKQASHDLQALGEAAVALPDERLRGLAISESLLDAILTYKKTRSHEGRRRQMQYVGKLMRREDDAELIADDEALTRWVAAHPQADLQQLRSLVRAARKDASLTPEKRSGRAFRELFQFVRQNTGAGHD